MKRIIKIGVIIIVLLTGFSMNSGAGLPGEMECKTIEIDCGNGTGSYALICGEDELERFLASLEMIDVVCGPE